MDVRFRRHSEYCGRRTDPSCANVQGFVGSGGALFRNVLSVGQVPTTTRTTLCPFDVFVFVPGSTSCDLHIRAGSSVMQTGGDGEERFVQDVFCNDTVLDWANMCDEGSNADVVSYEDDRVVEQTQDATYESNTHVVGIAVGVSLGGVLLMTILFILKSKKGRVQFRAKQVPYDVYNLSNAA